MKQVINSHGFATGIRCDVQRCSETAIQHQPTCGHSLCRHHEKHLTCPACTLWQRLRALLRGHGEHH